ncbi:MAG TPA: hypothetical protein PKB14_24510 [Rubrivivax sp.]|nr:hypothetical protein [Rubrivivax sp.]
MAGAGDQLAHDAPPVVVPQIQRQAALVAVHLQVQPALAGLGGSRHAAVLAAFDALDADRVGAQVAEQRGAAGAGDEAAEIENADTGPQRHEQTGAGPDAQGAD